MGQTTATTVQPTSLGPGGPSLTRLGVGCWAIGGPNAGDDGTIIGWGPVDDDESVRALQRALDLGVTLFDTADIYGCGHSERLVGQALAGHLDEVLIATKFGHTFDDDGSRRAHGSDVRPEYIRTAVQGSLRRLGRSYIDLYQLHIGNLPDDESDAVAETLESLQGEGLIRHFGWSADVPAQATRWAARGTCAAVQFRSNVFEDKREFFALCEQNSMAALVRSPLASGFLSGKYDRKSRLPQDDWRARALTLGWGGAFEPDGSAQPEALAQLNAMREVLTDGGRTLAQGALAWLWARSPVAVPIPGFKTAAQIEENVGALCFGPLPAGHLARIDEILGR